MAQNFLAIEPTVKSNPGVTPLNPYDAETDREIIAAERANGPLGRKMIAFDESTAFGDIANLYRPAASSKFDRGGEKNRGPAGAPIRVTLYLFSVRKLFVVA